MLVTRSQCWPCLLIALPLMVGADECSDDCPDTGGRVDAGRSVDSGRSVDGGRSADGGRSDDSGRSFDGGSVDAGGVDARVAVTTDCVRDDRCNEYACADDIGCIRQDLASLEVGELSPCGTAFEVTESEGSAYCDSPGPTFHPVEEARCAPIVQGSVQFFCDGDSLVVRHHRGIQTRPSERPDGSMLNHPAQMVISDRSLTVDTDALYELAPDLDRHLHDAPTGRRHRVEYFVAPGHPYRSGMHMDVWWAANFVPDDIDREFPVPEIVGGYGIDLATVARMSTR